MADITAGMVKDLRERTGLGMMECKKALVEANGDIELAIEELRKSSGMKAAKKAGRTAPSGGSVFQSAPTSRAMSGSFTPLRADGGKRMVSWSPGWIQARSKQRLHFRAQHRRSGSSWVA